MNFLEKLRAAADALIERITSNNAVHGEFVAFVNEAHSAIDALVQRIEALESAAVHAAADMLPGLPLSPTPPAADATGANGTGTTANQQ